MKERITVLLGAGAMIEATGVSTKSLTEKVISGCKKYKINKECEKSVVDVICDKFLSVYNKEVSAEDETSKIEKITSIISFEDIFHVLELLPNYNKNKSGYKGHISAYTIFSELNSEFENLFRTNIVTGLMKTDKLLWNPLNVYHNRFMNALLKNKRLILIGYGFSDLYINSLLYQYNAKHFEDRKMVMIDYVSDDDWQPTIEHPFYPSDKAIFTNLMHKSDHWYEKYMFKDKKKIIISEDNMVCICTSGFNSALNYIEKIKKLFKIS